MSGQLAAKPNPLLDSKCRSLVRRALAAKIVGIDDVKTVVASLHADKVVFTPENLATGLIGADLLTPWQASKLLAGKSRGFYLGKYKLLRPLGRGGMGMVYLGEHCVMNRMMAIKILPPDAQADARRVERFQAEARASAQLDHPNIVRAYDFNETADKAYIVMEYVDGIDLHQAIARDGVMSIDAAVDAVMQAAAGLAHAHERGIIHRDIKPSNLMLRADGVIKVSDLGLARIGWNDVEANRDKNRLTGTVDFVAPEQALNGSTVDARADIYSLGCTLYYLLTAKTPFQGVSVSQRLAKHQTSVPPDVRQIRTDCPPPIAHLIGRMMSKKPSERPASAAELLGQFEQIRGGPSGPAGNHTQLAEIASLNVKPAKNTFPVPTDDSLFSSGVDLAPSSGGVFEIDFDSLPGIQPVTPAGPPPVPSPLVAPPAAKRQPATDGKTSQSEKQMLLIGVGLTVAVLALLIVVGTAVYTVSRPPSESGRPRFKSTEEGKQFIVVQQQ